jgi:hypothetical protein
MALGVACSWHGWGMRTWGLDLATTPSNAGLVSIDWADGGRVRVHPARDRTIEAIVDLICDSEHRENAAAGGDYWAVDVPFGWPDGFGAFVSTHQDGPTDVAQFGRTGPDGPRRPWQAVSHRVTDRRVRDALPRVGGFDVSFDKLGATAAAWSVIEFQLADRGVRVDRAGLDPGSRVVETWPAAAWRIWAPGQRPPAACDWSTMHAHLAPLLAVDVEAEQRLSAKGGHARDALVCALVARAYATIGTICPEGDDRDAARREGWIHLPDEHHPVASLALPSDPEN